MFLPGFRLEWLWWLRSQVIRLPLTIRDATNLELAHAGGRPDQCSDHLPALLLTVSAREVGEQRDSHHLYRLEDPRDAHLKASLQGWPNSGDLVQSFG